MTPRGASLLAFLSLAALTLGASFEPEPEAASPPRTSCTTPAKRGAHS